MSQSPPAGLVRLREADVVRLCGLDAAARGLDLATRRAVTATRRTGARLDAAVVDEVEYRAWVELPAEISPRAMRWDCRCHAPPASGGDGPPVDTLACAHVAAILTAWIHSPGDFVEPTASPTPPPAPVPDAPTPRLHVTQPALLAPPASRRSRTALSLHDELSRLATHEVLAIARRVLGSEPDERDVRAALMHVLVEPARLAALLDRLDAGACDLLGDLVLLGGSITSADLDSLAQRANRPASMLYGGMGILERHGLVFPQAGASPPGSVSASSPWRRIAGWRMPPEVRAAFGNALSLRAPSPAAAIPSATRPGSPEAPMRFARVLRASPRPLCLALALLARAPEPYRRSSPPSRARESTPVRPPDAPHRSVPLLAGELDTRTVAELARGAGVPQGVVRLARRVLLWAREGGNASPLCDIGAVHAAERVFALCAGFRLWEAADAPGELADLDLPDAPVRLRIASQHAAWHPGLFAQEAAEAHAFLLRLVRSVPPGEWYPFQGFLETLWRLNPLFLRGRQVAFAQPVWWLERPGEQRPLRPEVREEWLTGEGEYVRALLTGPLHYWGALDLGLDSAGNLSAFRITRLGQFLFALPGAPDAGSLPPIEDGAAAPALPMRGGALAVHPLTASTTLFDALALWAAPTAIAGGRVVYTLSPDLACAAFDAGASPDGLLAQLRGLDPSNRSRLAMTVAAQLSDWRAQYGNVSITAGWALLEAEDEVALVEALTAVPASASRCRRLGPSSALVPPELVGALRDALARRDTRLLH